MYECCESLESSDPLEIKSELADVLIFAATVANAHGFDLHLAIRAGQPTPALQSRIDLEISGLQKERQTSQPQAPQRLINQECIDLMLRLDRAQQSHSAGQSDRL